MPCHADAIPAHRRLGACTLVPQTKLQAALDKLKGDIAALESKANEGHSCKLSLNKVGSRRL